MTDGGVRVVAGGFRGLAPYLFSGREDQIETASPANGATGLLGVAEDIVAGAGVTMVTARTYYDGPSLPLAAGSYLLMGAVLLAASDAASRIWNVKLWDGAAAAIATAQRTVPGAAAAVTETLAVMAPVTLAAPATYKISATSTVNNDVLDGAGVSPACSYLIALKVG